jgi:hypothetical protein
MNSQTTARTVNQRIADANVETSDAEIQQVIDQITAQLKGPLSNFERACLVADRKDARAELARRAALAKAGA